LVRGRAFFFFQAEDGIRDSSVTGVQTCALPIWCEERGPRGCLMNMVDDATGTTCCRLGEQETIWAAVGVLRSWIGKYGVPRALYTDWKNVYKRQPTEGERWRGKEPTPQLGRMCAGLEIG